MQLDLATGRYAGRAPTAVRRFGDLFGTPDDRIAYEIYGDPNQDDLDPPKLLQATTILYPGAITRGHFHAKPERGEMVLTLAGSGQLLLVNHAGETRVEPMHPGSIHDIDGQWAHRVANPGNEPLVFFVTWLSDCGHVYGVIPFPTAG